MQVAQYLLYTSFNHAGNIKTTHFWHVFDDIFGRNGAICDHIHVFHDAFFWKDCVVPIVSRKGNDTMIPTNAVLTIVDLPASVVWKAFLDYVFFPGKWWTDVKLRPGFLKCVQDPLYRSEVQLDENGCVGFFC